MTAKKLLAATGLLTLLLLAIPLIANASTLHKVQLSTDSNRCWYVNGTLKFTVENDDPVTLSCGNGEEVNVAKGDTVEFIVNSTEGILWISRKTTSTWTDIKDLRVDALYVNGILVCSDTTVKGEPEINMSSLESTLQITVTGTGWTQLRVDNNRIIHGDDSSRITIAGLYPIPGNTNLNLDISQQWYKGGAESVTVNGREVPAITGTGLLLLIGIGGVLLALSSRGKASLRGDRLAGQ